MVVIGNKQIDGYWYYPVPAQDVKPNSYVADVGVVVTVETSGGWTAFTLQDGVVKRKRPNTSVWARHASQSRPERYCLLIENLRSGIYKVGNVANAKIGGKSYEVYRDFDGVLLYKAAMHELAMEITIAKTNELLALVTAAGEIARSSVKMMHTYRDMIKTITSQA